MRGGNPVVRQGTPHFLPLHPCLGLRGENLHGVVEHQEVGKTLLTEAQLVLRGLEVLDDLPAFI